MASDTPTPAPANASRLRLLLAAENLFGLNGIEGASLREIGQAANQRNNAAVQYHFGSREALVEAIFAYRTRQLDAIRATMLQQLLAAGGEGDLPSLLKIVMLPHLELTDEQGAHPYARFLSHYFTRKRPAGMVHLADLRTADSEAQHKAVNLIILRLGFLSTQHVLKRLGMVYLMFLNMLGARDIATSCGLPVEPLLQEVEDMIEMATAAMAAPSRMLGFRFPVESRGA